MSDGEWEALSGIRFNWAPVADDVWRPSPFHVEGLHDQVLAAILDGLADADASPDGNPIGLAIQGEHGAGKTHLLGWARQKVQDKGGYFFLVGLLDVRDFWRSVVVSILDGLWREAGGTTGCDSQVQLFLRRLSSMMGLPRAVRRAVAGETALTQPALDTFVMALQSLDRHVARDSHETVRALILRTSEDPHVQDIADTYFQGDEEDEPGERRTWGMRRGAKPPQLIVRDLSRLLALTGPSVIAVDQIDTLIAQSGSSTTGDGHMEWNETVLLGQIADGLMSLREMTRRTLSVVACIPTTWTLIETRAVDTVRDRFRKATHLKTIPSADFGRALVAKRLGMHFEEIGFTPPYPTWPVLPSAFDDAPDFTPRQLLRTVEEHIRSCVLAKHVQQMPRLVHQRPGEPIRAIPGSPSRAPSDMPSRAPSHAPSRALSHASSDVHAEFSDHLSALDTRFRQLISRADITSAVDPDTEDAVMPALLAAGLTAWITGLGEAGKAFRQDPPPGAKPSLHARVRRILDETIKDEAHWSFRAIASNNAIAALHRIRAASTAAGLTEGITKRQLFILRNVPWSAGRRTQEAFAEFTEAGGQTLRITEKDLKILDALRRLILENPTDLPLWLSTRRPAHTIKVLNDALGAVAAEAIGGDPSVADPPVADHDTDMSPVVSVPPLGQPSSPLVDKRTDKVPPFITIGVEAKGGRPITVELEALRKHTAIFAGSGSGKTVLIRRLIEECALQGVSSIVLDLNNDLARLGERWPQPPSQWNEGDDAKAKEYHDNTDVVIWTPGREAGRPLTFQPLPDFRTVMEDLDELNEAIETAFASLAPRAQVLATTVKANRGQAVLREALRFFAHHGDMTLRGFITMLSALPEEASRFDDAGRIAADMAQTLDAATVNDPLFSDGASIDVGSLLTPQPGKRARVSVISFVGLAEGGQREGFVNQLQMALFSWIKKHPAGDRPLGGLLVMDEAQNLAPSSGASVCRRSTLALASQARKYGLGLVFATQAPKALHNQVPGNAATQFFGLLSSEAQINAAREMARAKGGDVPGIGRLGTGQFYAAIEGSLFVKMRAPLCLSYHPRSPLITEEVIERAKIAV